MTRWLTEAISQALTEEAERELIELAWGKKRVARRHLRDEAITALAAPGAVPLLLELRALLELRHRVGGGRESLTQIWEGEISSVWAKVKELWPEEVARLICKDESF